jgi:thioredoxin-related protein
MTIGHALRLAALAIALGMLLPAAGPGRAEEKSQAPVLNDDGLYEQPWFLESFLDLREDLGEAATAGKRFAIIWELKGCPYCKETHLVNFADPEIQAYVRDNFDILQLNLAGARRVTDFDGEEIEERALARKHGVRFTPTIQFFPADPEHLPEAGGREIEVARMPGYFRPPHFLAMFRYVREQAYETTGFRDYLRQAAR